LHDVEYITPLPSVMFILLWLRMSGWTANELSIHYWASVLGSIVSVSSLVHHRYCITLVSFLYSSSLGDCKCVHRKATAVFMSCLVHRDIYSSFSTM